MKKIIIIHNNNEQIITDVLHVFMHHIRCPEIARVIRSTKSFERDPADVLDDTLEEVFKIARCGMIAITNDQFFVEHFDGMCKKFNTFSIFTDPVAFAAHREKEGVYVTNRDDIPYLFGTIVNWLYAVEQDNDIQQHETSN